MEYYLPKLSLPWVSLKTAMKWYKEAGFDGIEVILWPWTNTKKVRLLAKNHHLRLRWHQPWSLQENPTHLHNWFLWFLFRLPRAGYSLRSLTKGQTSEPFVAYADRWQEVLEGDLKLVEFQTCATFEARSFWGQVLALLRRGPGLRHRISWESFLSNVRRDNLSVVFDIAHCLELKLGVEGVKDLPEDQPTLKMHLAEAWGTLCGQTTEIHLCNWTHKGHSLGRNTRLLDGVVDIGSFCRMVKISAWSGIVTLELSPLTPPFWPFWRKPDLRTLREEVERLFSP